MERSFQRVSTFRPVDGGGVVAEIVTATADGSTLIYGDSIGEGIGLVDLTDPANPAPAGHVALGGEVTTVAALGDAYVLAAVSRGETKTEPSGTLEVVALADPAAGPVASIELGGQPDSIDISPDGRYAAIAIENERDEEVVVDGVEGGLPQLPAGSLVIVDLVGEPTAWTTRTVELTGLADRFPEDPEPEFVAIDDRGIAAVTLQENDHVVLVDLESGTVTGDFSAGTVTVEGVDATEDGIISLTETITDVPREPDAIAWTADGRLVTANEGDLDGGSRGFTIFTEDGDVTFDSGNALDALAVRNGHYPESRSDAKGTEPEGVTTARYGDDDLIFVGAERGNFVAVYEESAGGAPAFRQFLPTGIAPEGLLAIPQRDLFVVAAEASPADGLASSIAIFERRDGAATYPTVVAGDDAAGQPIPWGTLSGLAGDPDDPDVLYAVPDNYYGHSRIFTLDVGTTPAVVTAAVELQLDGAPVDLDLEGISLRSGGGFWVVSEGAGTGTAIETTNQLIAVAADGTVESANGGWVGLSELTALPDGRALVLERDNQLDQHATVKRLYAVDLGAVEPTADIAAAPLVAKKLAVDLLPALGGPLPGTVPDKPEGAAVAADGQLYVVTDNDGIDDAAGATLLLRLGLIAG